MKPASTISRRDFLAATTAAATLGATGPAPATEGQHGRDLIDTHVYLARWPFDRLSHEQPAELAKTLQQRRVTKAWVGTLEGLLHKDVAGANVRLFEDCRDQNDPCLVPFGTVNLSLPDWEEDIRRCQETFHMPGIRLHPNYHGYTLDDERFTKLLGIASARKLILQLVAWMDDQKHPYFSMPMRHVDLTPLAGQMKRVPGARLVLSNAVRSTNQTSLPELAALPGVYFDFALVETEHELNELVKTVSPERIVFGSASPLGDFQSTRTKLHQANLSNNQSRAIRHETARKLQQGT